MKTLYLSILLLLLSGMSYSQSCNTSTGNVVIYANYDGGIININCDVNIPNLKIGVCTYEDCQINITGPFAGNVTQVIYAGFQGDNDNCNEGVNNTSITGVPANITSAFFAPPGVLADPSGNPNIICAYSCGTGNQGGCNTAAQVVAYFLNQFGGTLHTYYTQYNCWNGATFDISDNLCCSVPVQGIDVTCSASDPIVCVGQCISFTANATGNPTSYTWSFNGAGTTIGQGANPQNICYFTPGTYTATVTASNGNSTGTASQTITVIDCGLSNCVCPADLNQDGVIGVADLLIFLGLFGSSCE